MFNLGFPEMVFIGALALLILGPKRLPDLAKGLGKGIRDFKKALDGEDEKESLPKASSNHEAKGTVVPPTHESSPQKV